MKNKTTVLTGRGFSLVELMVVVAIIATMSATVVVGFKNTGDNLMVKQAAEYIGDVVKESEMRSMLGGYNTEIHFLPEHIAINEVQKGTEDWLDMNHGCPSRQVGFIIKHPLELTMETDLHGIQFSTKIYDIGNPPPKFCFDFESSPDTRWTAVFEAEGEKRNIRYIHFNLNRNKSNQFTLDTNGDDLMLAITGFDVHKSYFKNGNQEQQLSFVIHDTKDSTVSNAILLE